MADPRARGRELARESIERGDATGWFERLYGESRRDGFAIGWVDFEPNEYLVSWLRQRTADGRKPLEGRALVVGCGYGDDAEHLAAAGLAVTAFDISPTAVATCRERFPATTVEYVAADALEPPVEWLGAFDFVFEAYTVQVLPGEYRARCAASIARTLAPGGTLLVVARSRRLDDPPGEMPWPLTRTELGAFLVPGVRLEHLTELVESGNPPVPRFVAEFVRS